MSTRKKCPSGSIVNNGSRIPVPTSGPATVSPSVVVDLESDVETVDEDGMVLRSGNSEKSKWALHTSSQRSRITSDEEVIVLDTPSSSVFKSSKQLRKAAAAENTPPNSPKQPFSLKTKFSPTSHLGSRSPVSSHTSAVGGKMSGGKGLSHVQKLQAAAKLDFINKEASRKAKAVKFHGSSWVERNYPLSLDELFVHKKKVDDVTSWLKASLDSNRRPASKICVLTGNSGSGKTATLFLAAKELGFEIKEWINPMSLTDFQSDRLAKYEVDEVQGKNQFDTFSNFLFRASQYSTLPIKGRARSQNRLVVIEDFPNMFYRDTSSFHNILKNYAEMGGCPLVFIIPDSASGDCSANKLFPKNILQDLNIALISFNPVATSLMVKFLMKVCSKEGVLVDKSVVESIANASGGDIRCAINTLQFKLMKMSQPIQSEFKVPASKKPRLNPKSHGSNNNSKSDVVQKDETLFLFRALGKVLYAKREEASSSDMNVNVPAKAVEYLRSKALQENPEELVDKIEVSANTFLSFLQQNYVPFFGSMDDIVAASGILADSEYLLSRWPFDDSGTVIKNYKERESREEIALLTSSRGIMYANVHRAPNTWRPLKKPMFGDVKFRINNSVENVRHKFVGHGAVQTNFYSEELPFYAKLMKFHPRLWTSGQMGFIEEIGTFRKGHRQKMSQDTLNERDAFEEATSDTEDDVEEKSENLRAGNNGDGDGAKNMKDNKVVKDLQKACFTVTEDEDAEEDFVIEQYDSD